MLYHGLHCVVWKCYTYTPSSSDKLWIGGNCGKGVQLVPIITDSGCESADKWLLPSTSTIAICYYYSALCLYIAVIDCRDKHHSQWWDLLLESHAVDHCDLRCSISKFWCQFVQSCLLLFACRILSKTADVVGRFLIERTQRLKTSNVSLATRAKSKTTWSVSWRRKVFSCFPMIIILFLVIVNYLSKLHELLFCQNTNMDFILLKYIVGSMPEASMWQKWSNCCFQHIRCVSKNDTDVAHYNFNVDRSILIIFGRW